MTLHVGAGFSAIWAGNVKNGAFYGKKTDVTIDALNAAAIWLAEKNSEWIVEMKDGRRIILKTEIEKVKE